ncbi:MAG TPA: lipid droplet-associated protein [Pseudonocardiaceae bacterium]
MKPLPLPLRIAAGLAVTVVDRARRLPETLAELPVTVVSQALQLSMRVQQQVTELAIKGDDLLANLRPAEESPDWARFDEDESTGTSETPAPVAPVATPPVATPPVATPPASNGARSRFDRVPLAAVADLDETDEEEEPEPAEDETAEPDESDADVDSAEGADSADSAESPAHQSARNGTPPAFLPNYPELTVPQLRARLRKLNITDLQRLLRYERTHANRPEFTGMLSRRIATVRAAQ